MNDKLDKLVIGDEENDLDESILFLSSNWSARVS